MLKKYFLGLLIVLFSSVAYANVNETGKITRLIIDGNDHIAVWLDGPDVTTECGGGERWTVKRTDALFKEKLSMLLTAASTGKEIHLHHDTTWGCGLWYSNQIYYIDLTY